MSERLVDKIKRLWLEYRIRIVKSKIKKNVRKLDLLNNGSFMAFCWGVDEVTDYHVLAERSYKDHHVYGTQVIWYHNTKEGNP